MSSKKRTKQKRAMRDRKLTKRGAAVHTRRTPRAQKNWDNRIGFAKRRLNRQKFFQIKNKS
ncbi:hypothetical protein NVP1293O_02 [Vibrio phage 1.293.O._10N.261.52.E1]|nr:hypothetical protein NVP1293O_02 [Vibrio phage 1.293.O._10N.261.52.E1]